MAFTGHPAEAANVVRVLGDFMEALGGKGQMKDLTLWGDGSTSITTADSTYTGSTLGDCVQAVCNDLFPQGEQDPVTAQEGLT